jgi:hypothetical protein
MDNYEKAIITEASLELSTKLTKSIIDELKRDRGMTATQAALVSLSALTTTIYDLQIVFGIEFADTMKDAISMGDPIIRE